MSGWKFWGRKEQPAPSVTPIKQEPYFRISDDLLAMTAAAKPKMPFAIPKPPPGVVPPGGVTMAQDSGLAEFNTWASGFGGISGMEWLGFTILAELAQRPEYRRISRVKANEMTRKWIKLEAAGGENKSERVKQLNAAMKRLKVRDAFRRCAEIDGQFGRAHLYIDTGKTDEPDELRMKLSVTPEKIGKGTLKGFRVIEPIWVYPTAFNAIDPLKPDFYRPQAWYVMGKEIHSSRLLTFIGREMPDILKPAYMFGGMSLTQAAKPYVDLWLKDRSSVSELVEFFSTSVLKTNMRAIQQESGDQGLVARMELWTKTRKNRDVFMLDKDTEDFANVSAPLGTLDKLQAQAQEHICSVIGMPLVKYTGITPSGLNASSDGEIRVWYDEVHADQEDEFGDHLATVINVIQMSEFGEIDPDITHEFVALWQLDDAGKAAVEKTKADTDAVLIQEGILAPEESRERIANDPESIYAGLDLSAPAPGVPEGGPPDSDDPETNRVDEGAFGGSESGANSGV